MGTSPVRGRHAAPRTGLPPLVRTGSARHARPSQLPAGTALLTVAAGGVLTLALPVPGQTSATTAAASAPQPVASPTATPAATPAAMPAAARQAGVSDQVAETRQALADRASRSRRVPVAVVTTPPVAPAVSAPVPARALLPDCTQPARTGGANGRLPDSVLCDVGSGERLRADAARAYAALAVAYASRFGTEPCLIDGYRTLGEQQVLRRTKPRFAAPPGTSEHGWGLAVDLGCGVQSRRTVQHAWMQENGPRFGWVNPDWAQSGGARPEPWHWEFGTSD